MKTFLYICKEVGLVYWRHKKNKRARVYEYLNDKNSAEWYRYMANP